MSQQQSDRITNLHNLRWQKFPVLDDGFVCLVDWMGDDAAVVQAARVSYGRDQDMYLVVEGCTEDELKEIGATEILECLIGFSCRVSEQAFAKLEPKWGEWVWSDDVQRSIKSNRSLIRYLMRHRHTTPFEMVECKFLIRMPMDAWRQHIRHRTASVNEYSTRYTEAIDSCQKTSDDAWRLQSKSNKQGSGGYLDEWPEDLLRDIQSLSGEVYGSPGQYLSFEEQSLHEHARSVYETRLKFGVAKEQARKDLPLSNYTLAYWKIDLHNLFHYLSLRLDNHAQLEIRLYAQAIAEIVKQLFPICWEAFEQYRLKAMHLTALDIEVLGRYVNLYALYGDHVDIADSPLWPEEWRGLKSCRERDECVEKLKRLGLIKEDHK